MGALSVAIFDDDLASDVRGTYRDLIADGTSGPEATAAVLQRYRSALATPRDASVVWLALAATQWDCGRLEPRVRDEAFAVLDAGSDLQRWEHDPKLLEQRRRVLERLRAQLLTPQPREKRIRKRYRDNCDWEIGEVVAYRLLSGKMILLRVVDHITDPLGTSPVCELLDWQGVEPPTEDVVRRLGVRPQDWPPNQATDQFALVRHGPADLPVERVQRLGIRIKPAQRRAILATFSWKELDKSLERRYPSLIRGAG